MTVFDYYLKNHGKLLKCSGDTSEVTARHRQTFFNGSNETRQCSEVNFKEHNQSRNSRAIWLYSLMRIENRPTFCTKLFNSGVKSIGDLVDYIFFFHQQCSRKDVQC